MLSFFERLQTRDKQECWWEWCEEKERNEREGDRYSTFLSWGEGRCALL